MLPVGRGEPEQRARLVAIDRKAGAGDRARAERILIGAVVGRASRRRVALELFDDGEQVVRDGARLRRLRVRVRREDRFAMAIGEIDQRRPQIEHAQRQRGDELALPHPVHRHVDVVAAARGVQPAGDVVAAGVADQPLDEEEQVLAGAVVGRRRGPSRARCRRAPSRSARASSARDDAAARPA